MNWKLVVTLSMFGLAMAIGTVFVIPSNIEPIFWLAIFVACAVLIAKQAPGRYFLHGLALGLANCVWITTAHLVFFDTYVARHAQEAAMMQGAPLPGRAMMAITGPIIGLISGLVIGLFSWIASKIFKKPAAAGTTPAA
jgi:hypothetical protein